MSKMVRNGTALTEEALPVFGYTWFKVDPGDFITLKGAMRFNDSDADLTVQLIEKEVEKLPIWSLPGLYPLLTLPLCLRPGRGATAPPGGDWSSLLNTLLPFLMIGIIAMVMIKPQKEILAQGGKSNAR